MKLFDRVKLTSNRFIIEGIDQGDIGYIIEVYGDHHFEVEFSNESTGKTIAFVVAHIEDIELDE